jgi:SAM-dependent methyltransferase
MSKKILPEPFIRQQQSERILKKDLNISGKGHFQLLYQRELELEAEWLRRGAVEKVNSIESLLRINGLVPKRLLELGCGTGAVITECQRRNLAENYFAIDYSKEAIDYLKDHSSGIHAVSADITAQGVLKGQYDVVILSHVIEHLEKPLDFLQAVHSLEFSCLIVEVPLEDLPVSRLRSFFRDRTQNKAGHVQFFTATSFRRLIMEGNLMIIDERRYVPILGLDTLKFVCEKDGFGKGKYFRMVLTSHMIPKLLKAVWSRLCYAHYAVLCQKKDR